MYISSNCGQFSTKVIGVKGFLARFLEDAQAAGWQRVGRPYGGGEGLGAGGVSMSGPTTRRTDYAKVSARVGDRTTQPHPWHPEPEGQLSRDGGLGAGRHVEWQHRLKCNRQEDIMAASGITLYTKRS